MDWEVSSGRALSGRVNCTWRRHGIHDAHDGLSGLHPFVIIDVFAFDDAGERRPELGLLEHIEGVVISRAGLRIAGSGSFEFLLRDGFVLQQPLHALQLRAGLFVCGAVGGDLQLDVAGVELGQQRPLLHVLALRHRNVQHLSGKLERQIHGVVGRSHAREILVDDPGARRRDDLHRADRLRRRLTAAAAAQREKNE